MFRNAALNFSHSAQKNFGKSLQTCFPGAKNFVLNCSVYVVFLDVCHLNNKKKAKLQFSEK